VELLKYILEEVRRKEEKEKIPVIRMEIDYELLTLYDALQANDTVQIIKSKERLKQLRKKLISLLEC
jgi:molybdopterin converting factor small subunit